MGACEVPTGEYYVFLKDEDASYLVKELNDIFIEHIINEVEDDMKDIIGESYDMLLNDLAMEYIKDDYILSFLKDKGFVYEGYHTGLTYLSTDALFVLVQELENRIYDGYYIYDILEEDEEEIEKKAEKIKEIFSKKLEELYNIYREDSLNRLMEEIIDKYELSYLGTVVSSCNMGFGEVKIISDRGISEYYYIPEEET